MYYLFAVLIFVSCIIILLSITDQINVKLNVKKHLISRKRRISINCTIESKEASEINNIRFGAKAIIARSRGVKRKTQGIEHKININLVKFKSESGTISLLIPNKAYESLEIGVYGKLTYYRTYFYKFKVLDTPNIQQKEVDPFAKYDQM